MTDEVFKKVIAWYAGGDTGLSSEAMAARLSGQPCRRDYPRDPDDLGRCVRLLDAIPELRSELFMMVGVCKEWERLIKNWDELEALYRAEIKDGSKAHDYACGCRMHEILYKRTLVLADKEDEE